MFQFDILSLIPQSLKQQAADAAVDFVSDQAKKFLGDELSGKIKKLRSDAAFQTAFMEGLQRAADRFAAEYTVEDEDLVAALAADKTFLQNEEIQQALLAILKKPGVYLSNEQEIVVQSFDSVLPSRLNRDRVNRAVLAFLKCLAEEVWNLPELRPAYELQFQRMSAETLREQVNLQKAQLQATVALSGDIRNALLQLTDAIADRKLLPSGDPLVALPAPKKVHHNLPRPDYKRFVGRKAELKQIRQLLLPKTRHFVVTIDGIGGIGKSALALEVAHIYLRHYDKLPEEERFEAIIWTSAKQTVLTAEGIATRSQTLRTLDDIYTTIAVTLEREDIAHARTEEQDGLVRHALSQQRTLLIVDNLETVDDERVMAFIREVPEPTKVIVTTRHRLDVAYPVRLVGMEEADALTLIADEAKKKGVTLTDDEAHRLYQRTGGVPLAIVWSVAQMGFGYGVEAVLTRLGQPASDIARFCFEGAVQRIKAKPAYKLLLALSLFATDASREALGYVADLPELDQDEGLVELEKLSLVNKKGGRFQALPLTLVYSKAELMKRTELETQLRGRWVEFLLNFLLEQSQRRHESLEDVNLETDNILRAMDWCWQTYTFETFITFAQSMDYYLWITGNWSGWNRYIELGLKAAVTLGAELVQANFLSLLAGIRNRQDDLDEAQDFTEQAIAIYRFQDDKKWQLAYSIWGLASIYVKRGEIETARGYLSQALAIAEEIKGKTLIARVQRKLAEIDIVEGNYELAESRLKEAQQLLDQDTLPHSAGLSSTYRLLGRVSFLKQNYELANQYFQESLEMGQKVGSQQHIAEAKESAAELELASGNIEKGKKLAQEAIEVFTKLGMKRELKEMQVLLERLD